MTKYIVHLSKEEEDRIRGLLKRGKRLSRDYLRAQILLMSHEGEKREKIAESLKCSYSHICNVVRRYCIEGSEKAITDKERKGRPTKLQGKQRAHLIALACSDPPEGRSCWTMQLLAGRCVELNLVDFISGETVRRLLKKTKLSRGKRKVGAFPV
jgi:transposase